MEQCFTHLKNTPQYLDCWMQYHLETLGVFGVVYGLVAFGAVGVYLLTR